MKNTYEIRKDSVAIFINSPKYGAVEVLIDEADLLKVGSISGSWYVTKFRSSPSLYIRADGIKVGDKITSMYLHRYITDAPSGTVVDHINHDTLDNRRSTNLRICTRAENNQNQRGARSDSKSGIRGVCWCKKSNKWRAYASVGGVQKAAGYFDDILEAESAAKEARSQLMTHSTN